MECIILSVNDTYMDAQEVMHMTDYSKITALYSRLSVGDEDRDGGESNSIQNQKIFLENYARGQHLTNIRHYIDDDESGRFFDRSAYSRMMDDVENGKIGVCIMKDLTRWGRDYLQVGNAMEIFRRNNYKKKAKKPIWVKWGAIAACLCLMIPLTAFAVDIIQYNAAVDYLNSLGIAVEDLSDYSHKEIKEAAKTIDAGESNPLTEEILSLIPENKEPLDTPTQVTSEQIKELTPTMTREDVLSLLGDTQDVGSGIYIYLYEVDQQYLLRIPFASDEAQLGVTGEDLLKALVPISGDIAPMVYVNDTLYQIVDSQPNFADEKSSFNLLGKIENTVSSSEEPKENFQANDDIVGAAVYQYGDNIVVEFEGKYWLYEHYHNTDFDGNSD